MAAIYPEITVEWQGKQYTTRMTMRAINRIEDTVSLAKLAQRLSEGDPPLSHLAVVFGSLLREAGANVDDSDVLAAMLGQSEDETEIDQTALIQTAALALSACFPEVPAKTGKRQAKRKRKPVK